MNNILVV